MRMALALALLINLISGASLALNLTEFLQLVQKKHHTLQSLQVSRDSVEDKREEGDMELTPSLNLSGGYTDDKKVPGPYTAFGGIEAKSTVYSLALNKEFSSGTNLGVSANLTQVENPGLNIPPGFLPPWLRLDRFGTGSLGLTVSQSLWRNFFGRATRLRWQRENASAAAQTSQYDLQKQQLLQSAEVAYWDFLYAQEDLRLRLASLDRAKRIESWTAKRTRDGISDEADLLQTKALVAQRQQQLLASQDSLKTAHKVIQDLIELGDSETFPEPTGDIRKPRSLASLIEPLSIAGQGGKGKIVQLESFVAALNARATLAAAREVEDRDRPDLVLQGGYATNSYEADLPHAATNITDTNTPTVNVGVKFTYFFDSDAKNAQTAAARKDSLAAQLLAERKALESESAWSELNRKNGDLTRQVESAEVLSDLQTRRAKAQSIKFNRGRSVTTDVVNAEQDAAEAELSLTKLQSEQRKIEAQSRLFVSIKE